VTLRWTRRRHPGIATGVAALAAVALSATLALLVIQAPPAAAQGSRRADAAQSPPGAPAAIKGRIFDSETGESMPYTNVFIAGTNIGTMAFTDGFYILRGLRPGTYTIRASYISYAIEQVTVTVGWGDVVDLDFNLRVEAIMLDPFDVEAERRLVEIERTGSSHYLTGDEMRAMPLDNIVDMIAQKPGVTLQDNEIHIRGGRADDTRFIVDGLTVSDPLAGGGYGYQIDPSIINEIEVMTGGFNAEHGQAVSGLVNVSTREGGDRFEGSLSFKRDYIQPALKRREVPWRDLSNFDEPHNIDILNLSMSGPDPITGLLDAVGLGIGGRRYLLLSGTMDIRDGYLPIYSRGRRLVSPLAPYSGSFWTPRQQNDWSGLAKWTWHMTPSHKLSLHASRAVNITQGFRMAGEGYPRPFLDNLDQYLVFTQENILTQAYWRQVVSETSWYELQAGRNFSRMHANINGNDDFTTYPPLWGLDENGRPARPDPAPDGQLPGSADRWHDHYSEAWTAKGSYSFMAGIGNQFKTGFEASFTEMQLVDLRGRLAFPPAGKLALREDVFRARPTIGSAFIQDTVTYNGLIVNAGLRADVWAPGPEVERVMANPDDYLFITPDMAEEYYGSTFGAFGKRWKARISPRVGLSFYVTERDKFFFNYGHFSQWPRFTYVYPQLEAQTATEVQLLGNPNLDPKITVEYETGLQHQFPGLWSLGVTFFNRDIYGYAKAVRLEPVEIGFEETPDPDDTGTVTINPVRYFNGDSARSLGIELTVVKRTTRWLSGSASLELQRATGTNSKADEQYLLAIYEEGYEPTASIGGLTRTPLLWDKPWTVSLNLDFSVFEDAPRLLGLSLPRHWSANLLVRAEAGQRYTPAYYEGPDVYLNGEINSAVGPMKSTMNLRLSKFFRLGSRRKLTLFLEARNILNHQNYRRVNPFTGDGYQIGDYNPRWVESWQKDPEYEDITTDTEAYSKGVVNPSFTENPRVILWGMSFQW